MLFVEQVTSLLNFLHSLSPLAKSFGVKDFDSINDFFASQPFAVHHLPLHLLDVSIDDIVAFKLASFYSWARPINELVDGNVPILNLL